MLDSVFAARGDGVFLAGELARGPWDPDAQHGGAPAALLMRALEQLPAPDEVAVARVTYEFLRPVPLGQLNVNAEVVRPGRRVQLLEATLRDCDGSELARARGLQVRAAHVQAVDAHEAKRDGGGQASKPADSHRGSPAAPQSRPPGPEQGRANDFRPPHRPMFAPDAIELRFVSGQFHGGGGATAWFRLRAPLLAGEEPSSLQRLAAAADFGNGISATLPWEEYVFINPDLTLYVERQPRGEWVCLESQTRIAAGGIGLSESTLYDLYGRVGCAVQALLVAPR